MGGGAGGNQQPAGAFSLRERCDCRDINQRATPNDSHAVALRTRKHLAEPIVAGPNCNIVVRSEEIGSAKETKLLQTGADCLINRCGHHSAAVRPF
jgi:hypothetical protein